MIFEFGMWNLECGI